MFVDEIRRHKQKALIPSPLYENEQNKWEISQWILLRERERERERESVCFFIVYVFDYERREKGKRRRYVYLCNGSHAIPCNDIIACCSTSQGRSSIN